MCDWCINLGKGKGSSGVSPDCWCQSRFMASLRLLASVCTISISMNSRLAFFQTNTDAIFYTFNFNIRQNLPAKNIVKPSWIGQDNTLQCPISHAVCKRRDIHQTPYLSNVVKGLIDLIWIILWRVQRKSLHDNISSHVSLPIITEDEKIVGFMKLRDCGLCCPC